MKNLTAIYWIKNEARFIPEYIEFHLLQGFDHFIMYDNGSTDNLLDVCSPYIESGLLEIRYYPSGDLPNKSGPYNSKNFYVMDHCVEEQRGKTRWLHFHALDERLFCPTGQNLVEFLKDYEEYGGVSVAWMFFNSNGHIKRPDGLITDCYTAAHKDPNRHIKTVLMPDKTAHTCGNPHNFRFIGTHSVDENFNRCDGFNNIENYTFDKIKLHHYVSLSRQDYDEKNNKGILDFGPSSENSVRPNAEIIWESLHAPSLEIIHSDELAKYSKQIKDNILNRYIGREHLLEFINH